MDQNINIKNLRDKTLILAYISRFEENHGRTKLKKFMKATDQSVIFKKLNIGGTKLKKTRKIMDR